MISRTEVGWMGIELWEQGKEELNKLKFWKKTKTKLFQGIEAQGLYIESNKKHRKKKKLSNKKRCMIFKKKFKAIFQSIYQ